MMFRRPPTNVERGRRVKGAHATRLFLTAVCLTNSGLAQWNCAGGNCTTTGNVGIGVTTPYFVLDISGWNGVRVAGGDSTPVQIQGDSRYNWAFSSIFSMSTGGMALQSRWNLGATNLVFQPDSGNVGIGTAAPHYKLAVNGTIGAKEVVVTNGGWADYVFKPEYRLRSLSEVRAYIAEQGRLPEMPSEAEIKTKGVGLGEIQAKLLAKVEELTLHLIEMSERNAALEARVAGLEAQAVRNENRGKRGGR